MERPRQVEICVGADHVCEYGENKIRYRFITITVVASSQDAAEQIVQERLQKLIGDS